MTPEEACRLVSRIDDDSVLMKLAQSTYASEDSSPNWSGSGRPETTSAAVLCHGITARDFCAWNRAHFGLYESFVEHLPLRRRIALDLGCGGGQRTNWLGEFFERVIGLDKDEQAIAFAHSMNPRLNVAYRHGLIKWLAKPPGFDAIYCVEVFEHVEPSMQDDFLRAALGLLAPDGRLFLTTPREEVRQRPHVGILRAQDEDAFLRRWSSRIIAWDGLSVPSNDVLLATEGVPSCARGEGTHHRIVFG